MLFETNKTRILLAGESEGVFAGAVDVGAVNCRVCAETSEVVSVVEAGDFEKIVVVMSSFGGRLGAVLEKLREISPSSKIILAAQMYEEPRAMELVRGRFNGRCVADDYLISPLDIKQLDGSITRSDVQMVLGHVDEKDKMIEELTKLAIEDDLTHIKNRRYVREFSQQIIARAGSENLQVTVLVFDIDDFKHYNDEYGHSAGDKILRQAATLMQKCCREHDVVGRIGGDEFAVVFWDRPRSAGGIKQAEKDEEKSAEQERRGMTEHPKEAFFIAERLRREMNSAELHMLGPGGKGVLTISGGLATFPRDGSTAEALFEQADKALLEAKRSGKNRIQLVGKPIIS